MSKARPLPVGAVQFQVQGQSVSWDCLVCCAGELQADSGCTAAPPHLGYGLQASPLHPACLGAHLVASSGALESPKAQAGPPSFNMAIASPFPPLCGDEELLASEAAAPPFGCGQAEGPHNPTAFAGFLPAEDSPVSGIKVLPATSLSPLKPPPFPGEPASANV